MKLLAKIKSSDLLMKLQHEKGATFFRPGDKQGEYEVIYFSGNRVVHFKGELKTSELEQLRNVATECKILDLDISLGFVRIVE
ncbi:MAG: hypothetical protein OEW69_10405 [Nitrospirota bacterium]|nr:hypothetical protein [Nitrospirota bacterium]